VSTLAGTGSVGLMNGPGDLATFRDPVGVAVGADGSVFVADSGNHVVRRIEAN
jgi:glucose/arabinose dehydrogenase